RAAHVLGAAHRRRQGERMNARLGLVVLLLAAGCAKGPTKTYDGMVAAAREGNLERFSEGFTDLHTLVYKEVLEGRGYGLADARPSVELAHALRIAPVVSPDADAHPRLRP
ncbi:MAG: hypothetical protein WCJ30_05440, partial [Deltaproteobacteria bacterium]